MGTEVLRPQDVFLGRLRSGVHTASFQRRRNIPAINSGHKRKTYPKRKFEKKRPSHGGNISDPRRKDEISNAGGLVMGKVALLRRGESLSSLVTQVNDAIHDSSIGKSIDDLDVGGYEVNGSGSQSIDIYAGSAFFTSPSPRSVPLPSFFSKNSSNDDECINEITPLDVGGTKILRRLLRLNSKNW